MRVQGNEYTTAVGRQVLLVDGDTARADRVAAQLEQLGCRVARAASAREALRLPLPETIVAAIGLVDGNGLELTAELRTRGGELSAVLYTDRPSYDACRRAWRIGASDLLRAPVDPEELAAAIERLPATTACPDVVSSARAAWTLTDDDAEPILRELVALGVRAGLGPASRARLASATAEAIDNARRHGYATGAGAIEIAVAPRDGGLEVVVGDAGCGFDVLRGELDAAAPLLPGGGTAPGGLARLRALTDGLRIESDFGTGTRVALVVHSHPAAFEGDGDFDLGDRDWLDPDQSRRLLAEVRGSTGVAGTDLSPALAVALGRLMAATDSSRLAQRALWS